MSMDLRRQLIELSQGARPAPDAEAILAKVRRRRRRQLVSSVAAAAAVLILVGVVTGLSWFDPDPAPSGPPLRLSPFAVAPHDAPVLPSDRGIGRGALVYTTCYTCPAFLVAADGSQYQLAEIETARRAVQGVLASGAASLPVTLSPDGRWLGFHESVGGVALRDLSGTRVRHITWWPWAWSLNGRFLFGQSPFGVGLVELDLRTGREQTVSNDYHPLLPVVEPDGNLLYSTTLCPEPDDSLAFERLDLASGEKRFAFTVEAGHLATGYLHPGETITPHYRVAGGAQECGGQGYLDLGNGHLGVMVYEKPPADPPQPYVPEVIHAMLVVDMATGEIGARIELPHGAGFPHVIGDDLLYAVQMNVQAPTDLFRTGEPSPLLVARLPATGVLVPPGGYLGTSGPAIESANPG
jgi:hypothetical protein